MRNGAGTPYIVVTDFEGNIITEKITRFNYVFSESTDDMTTITFEYDDPMFPDNAAVQEHRPLTVKWGYRENPTVFNSRTVYIRECMPNYAESTMSLEVKCSDKASYIRSNKPQVTHDGNPYEITRKIANDNGLTFDEETYAENMDEGTHDKILSNTLEGYPQAGTNDMRFLNDMWNEQEGGPYTVEGRDDNLIVRKNNYGQKPKRAFIYGKEPHELLTFKPETKNRMYGKNAKQNIIQYFDPISGTVKAFKVGSLEDKTTRLGDVEQDNRDYFPSLVQAYQANEIRLETKNAYPDDALPSDEWDKGWGGYYHGESLMNQNDNTNTQPNLGRDAMMRNVMAARKKNADRNNNPGWNEELAKANALSERQAAANQTNPGTALIVGDPLIECSIVLTFMGIAKKYSGNYYIVRAEHIISRDNGFTVELSFRRNATKKTGTEAPGTKPVESDVKVNKVAGGYEVIIKGKTVKVSEDDIKDYQLRKTKSDFTKIKEAASEEYDPYNNPYDEAGNHR